MQERLLIDNIKIVENHTEDTEVTHEFSKVRVEFVENVTFNEYGQIVGNKVLILVLFLIHSNPSILSKNLL